MYYFSDLDLIKNEEFQSEIFMSNLKIIDINF